MPTAQMSSVGLLLDRVVSAEKSFSVNNGSLREFAAPLGKSYQCKNRSLALSENFRLTALSERLQAFQLQDGKFGEGKRWSLRLDG